jgi:hypothetical protein
VAVDLDQRAVILVDALDEFYKPIIKTITPQNGVQILMGYSVKGFLKVEREEAWRRSRHLSLCKCLSLGRQCFKYCISWNTKELARLYQFLHHWFQPVCDYAG